MLLVFIFLAILSGIIYSIIFAIVLLLLLLIGILFSRITLDGYVCINNINIHNIQNIKRNKNEDYGSEYFNFNNENNKRDDSSVIKYSVLINVYLFKFLNIGFLSNFFKISIEINSKFLKIFNFKIDIRKVYLKILENIDLSNIEKFEKDIKIVKAKDIALLNLAFEKIKIYGSIGLRNDFVTIHILTFINILLSIIFGNLNFEKETNKRNKFNFNFLDQEKFYFKINPIFSSEREAIEYMEYLNYVDYIQNINKNERENLKKDPKGNMEENINENTNTNVDNKENNIKLKRKKKLVYEKINLESKISANTINIIKFLLEIRKLNKDAGLDN